VSVLHLPTDGCSPRILPFKPEALYSASVKSRSNNDALVGSVCAEESAMIAAEATRRKLKAVISGDLGGGTPQRARYLSALDLGHFGRTNDKTQRDARTTLAHEFHVNRTLDCRDLY
jgi:hypothetical protein